MILLWIAGALHLNSQPLCDIKTDPNESYQSRILKGSTIQSGSTQIMNVDQLQGLDDRAASFQLAANSSSDLIRITDFDARLPLGSLLAGYEIKIKAKADLDAVVEDVQVRLLDATGNFVGEDKRGKSIYGKPWSVDQWSYGAVNDLWDTDLSASEVNSANFGVALQFANTADEPVVIAIDQLVLKIYYFMPLEICGHPCVAILTTEDTSVVAYNWEASPELVTEIAFEQPHIFNIFAEQSPFGNYSVCLEKVYDNGTTDQCCRVISYKDCTSGSIGDFLWMDDNVNGQQDVGELGVEGVTVQLYSSSEQLVDEMTTDVNGRYEFAAVFPGDYFLMVKTPKLQPTVAMTVMNSEMNSDFTHLYAPGSTGTITVEPGVAAMGIDFGFVEYGKTCGQVYIDKNLDGSYEAGIDESIEDVLVKLMDEQANIIARTRTEADGTYCFVDVYPGTYEITFDVDNEFLVNEAPQSFFVGSGSEVMGNNLGLFRTGSVGDFLWDDLNRNGLQDDGEPGIGGVEIILSTCAGVEQERIITDASGRYFFSGLIPGTYNICVADIPEGYYTTVAMVDDENGSDLVGGGSCTRCITVEENQELSSVDLGITIGRGDIGSYVWVDENSNGLREGSENGLGGVIISLYDCKGEIVQTMETDVEGRYVFSGVETGDYNLCLSGVDNRYTITSDLISGSCSACFSVGNEDLLDYDFSVELSTADLRTVVWLDNNQNGIQEDNEPGLSSLSVQLLTCNGVNVRDDFSNAAGQAIFTDLVADTYYVTTELPEGLELSQAASAVTQDNISITTTCAQLSGIDLTLEIPLVRKSESIVGNFIYQDDNGNGLLDNGELGKSGVAVTLNTCSGQFVAETVTDDFGSYSFSDLPASNYEVCLGLGVTEFISSVSNGSGCSSCFAVDGYSAYQDLDFGIALERVELGAEIYIDDNDDGIRNAGELGLDMAEIELMGCSGDLIARASSVMGMVIFQDQNPGNYYAKVTLPAGYEFVNGLGSITDQNGPGTTACVAVSDLQLWSIPVKAIVVPIGSIGNLVWLDENANGLFDSGDDIGLSDVSVSLEDCNGNLVSSTVTDENGLYLFDNLGLGQYNICVEAPEDLLFSSSLITNGSCTACIDLNQQAIRYDIDISLIEEIVPPPPTEERVELCVVVYEDVNENLVQDAGEISLQAVMDVLDCNGIFLTTLEETTSGYCIEELEIGFYEFSLNHNSDFIYPNGGIFDMNGSTTCLSIDSDLILEVPLQPAPVVDLTTTISVMLYQDLDEDETFSSGDEHPYLAEVQLMDCAGNLVQTALTNLVGELTFNMVDPGDYFLAFPELAGYEILLNNNGTTAFGPGTTDCFAVAGIPLNFETRYQALPVIDPTTTISVLLYHDLDEDETFSNGDEHPFLAEVLLMDCAGNLVQTMLTDLVGDLTFSNVQPGDYYLAYPDLSGYEISLDNNGTAVYGPGTTDCFTVAGIPLDFEVGYQPLPVTGTPGEGSVTGIVWNDLDRNSLLDNNDLGFSDVVVRLFETTNMTLVEETTTNDQGLYLFQDIAVGNYIIFFEEPFGYGFSEYQAGGLFSDIDSEVADPAGWTLAFQLEKDILKLSVNAGLFQQIIPGGTAIISGLTWLDADANGILEMDEPAQSNVSVSLYDDTDELLSVTMTDDTGAYEFANLRAGSYYLEFGFVADYVFTIANAQMGSTMDSDVDEMTGRSSVYQLVDGQNLEGINAGYKIGPQEAGSIIGVVWNDANGNGKIGVNEVGLQGVLIALYDEEDIIVASTSSGPDGTYSFENLSAGNYYLEFSSVTDFSFTVANAAPGTRWDSDANPGSGQTAIIVLEAGEKVEGINAGYMSIALTGTASITGQTWIDDNENGLLDIAEAALSGVLIELFDAQDILLGTQESFSDGTYLFDGLFPGNYYLKFNSVNGYEYTIAKAAVGTIYDSDVNESTGETRLYQLANNQNLQGINAGYRLEKIRTASISGKAWLDQNENGLLGVSEAGLENVSVELYDTNGNLLEEVTTDSNGDYSFTALSAANYYLKFNSVNGYEYTIAKAAVGTIYDSDVNESTGETRLYQLANNQNLQGINAGYRLEKIRTASISGKAWLDQNENGLLGVSEAGLENVSVELYDTNGNLLEEVTTDSNGDYSFTVLPAANYYLKFNSVNGYEYTIAKAAVGTIYDSEVNESTGETRIYALSDDQALEGINAGYRVPKIRTASIEGLVWEDSNQNGLLGVAESGIADVSIQLYDSNDNVISSSNSDTDGRYTFASLAAGSYYLEFGSVTGYVYTTANAAVGSVYDSDVDESTGQTKLYQLEDDQVLAGINAGYATENNEFASITGRTWNDENENGILDNGETSMRGVEVTLFDEADVEIDSRTTNASGVYLFEDLTAGNFYLLFSEVTDFEYTTAKAAVGTTTDSDVDEETGLTRIYPLTNGQTLVGINAGYKESQVQNETYDLSGFAWEDLNGNGIREIEEERTADIRVKLLDDAGAIVLEMMTDSDGTYSFRGLDTGSYQVEFMVPLDSEITLNNQGTDTELDSDVRAGAVTEIMDLTADVSGVNLGYYYPGVLTGWVWLDYNNNGIQDTQEPGTNNYIINLYEGNGNFLERAFTNFNDVGEQGYYIFRNLTPGDYYIQVFSQQGVSYAPANATDDEMDSDITGKNGPGTSDIIQLESRSFIDKIDIGLILEPATIGDRLWLDVNADGVQDAGELGLNGITVGLYNINDELVAETITSADEGEDGFYSFEEMYPTEYYVKFELTEEYVISPSDIGGDDSADSDINNSNGYGTTSIFLLSPGETDFDVDGGVYVELFLGDRVWHDRNLDGIQDANEPGVRDVKVDLYRVTNGVDLFIASTRTDGLGFYTFNDLINSDYYIIATPASDFEFTEFQVGSDSDKDSDVSNTGVSNLFTIRNNVSIDDIDIGLVRPANQIAGHIWDDLDKDGVFNTGEPFLEGITVWLMSDQDQLLSEMKTATGGRYVFDDLADGSYYVMVVPPSGFDITTMDSGGDDMLDSDFNASGVTAFYDLVGGTVERHVDLGLVTGGEPLTTVYPNPAMGGSINLKTRIHEPGSMTRVTIIDASGSVVSTVELQSEYIEGSLEEQLDIIDLPAGLYAIKLTAGRSADFLKFIKIE